MSFLDRFQRTTESEDHIPIINKIASHVTESGLGGWEEWSAGCVCGFFDKGTPGKWYIPSKEAAQRVYNLHYTEICGGLITPVEEEEDAVILDLREKTVSEVHHV